MLGMYIASLEIVDTFPNEKKEKKKEYGNRKQVILSDFEYPFIVISFVTFISR